MLLEYPDGEPTKHFKFLNLELPTQDEVTTIAIKLIAFLNSSNELKELNIDPHAADNLDSMCADMNLGIKKLNILLKILEGSEAYTLIDAIEMAVAEYKDKFHTSYTGEEFMSNGSESFLTVFNLDGPAAQIRLQQDGPTNWSIRGLSLFVRVGDLTCEIQYDFHQESKTIYMFKTGPRILKTLPISRELQATIKAKEISDGEHEISNLHYYQDLRNPRITYREVIDRLPRTSRVVNIYIDGLISRQFVLSPLGQETIFFAIHEDVVSDGDYRYIRHGEYEGKLDLPFDADIDKFSEQLLPDQHLRILNTLEYYKDSLIPVSVSSELVYAKQKLTFFYRTNTLEVYKVAINEYEFNQSEFSVLRTSTGIYVLVIAATGQVIPFSYDSSGAIVLFTDKFYGVIDLPLAGTDFRTSRAIGAKTILSLN